MNKLSPTFLRAVEGISLISVLLWMLLAFDLPVVRSRVNFVIPENSFLVNTLGDTADSSVGDDHCDTDGNLGNGDQCTLRAAIQEANAVVGDDAIAFELGAGVATIELNTTLPDIQDNLFINGPGANLLTVRRSIAGGTPTFRVFTISMGANVTISGLTISNGSATGSFPANVGGGILNNEATLVINDCVITGNTADAGGGISNLGNLTINNSSVTNNNGTNTGGGIANSTGGTQSAVLTIRNSTIANNSTQIAGGGIFNIGHASLTNSTLSGNSALSGGGINNANPMTLINVTLTNNTATNQGGGIFNPGIGQLTLSNTLIAGNTSPSGPDGSGANFISQDYNLIGNTSGLQINGAVTHNITNVNALLGPLGNNGGPTLTHDLLHGSPAIDAGNSLLITDQRGQPRPIDHPNAVNAADGNASDIGAYEAPRIQVNSTADSDDGSCTLLGSGNGCTLREAINATNTSAVDLGSITFAPALTASGPATITLLTALPNLSSNQTINGPGANLLTVQRSTAGGTPNFRIFTVNLGTTVTITDLTISNGNVTGIGNGGGVLNDGTLTMTNCNVYGNTTSPVSGFGLGGGIFNAGSLILNDCNIGGLAAGQPNTVGASGGGISSSGTLSMTRGSIVGNFGNGIGLSGTATLNGVTITNNTEQGNGGAGVLVLGTASIINCLIANNTGAGGGGGGIRNGNGTLTVVNSTISGNSSIAAGGGLNSFNANTTLINVTVTNNRSDSDDNSFGGENGGGVKQSGGPLLLHNTIVVGNFIGSGVMANDAADGLVSTSSFNLIGVCDNCGLANGANNNQIGVSNAGLGVLADNGGPTRTHALLAGSPALDAGGNALVANPPFIGPPFTDQRGPGFNRIVDGPDGDATATVDIGACETQVTLANIADASTNEDAQLIIPFEIDDRGSITSITVTSNNQILVPNDPSHLRVTDAGTTEVITINPADNEFGSAEITVTVNRTSGSASSTFTVTVNSVNDAPSFIKGADQTINEDAGAQTILNWATNMSAGPPNESGQALTFQVIGNTNPALFSSAPAVSSNGTLTYTPAPNANGSAGIMINLKDDGGTANGGIDTSVAQIFVITVNPVNDAPSFTRGPSQIVNEDSGAQTISNWAINISAGPSNESGQTLTFEVTSNTNPALFSSAPAISSTGTLTYTPAPNANGSAFIFIVLKDNGGVANNGQDTSPSQNFTITVNAVNDAPSFVKGSNQTVNNNAGPQSVSNWATAISAGPPNESGQILTFQVTGNTNPGLFAVSPTVSSSGTLSYSPATNAGGVATITISLRDNGGTANGGQNTSAAQTFDITVNPVGGFVRFNVANFLTTENSFFTQIVVQRDGDNSRAVTVNYATAGNDGVPCSTANGLASSKCDFTTSVGRLQFAAGETVKTITVLISQDSFVEGPETLTLSLSDPTGFAAVGTPSTGTLTIEDDASESPTNAIDDVTNFVRQHYHDFLNREPDAGGLEFWKNEITSCGSDQACIEVKRINVSAAFYLSIEFQHTGYLVERVYKVAFGDAIGTSVLGGTHQIAVPIVRLEEFLPDTQSIRKDLIVLQIGWEQILENNKQMFVAEFVQRPRFVTAHPTSLTPAQFVDRLFLNAGVTPSAADRQAAIDEFGGAADSSDVAARARALRRVAENQTLQQSEFNRAFVLMQYFGYLRRNPNDPQDSDYTGFDFWLTKLNDFNGNFIHAEMVKAFISSIEYRQRFGP